MEDDGGRNVAEALVYELPWLAASMLGLSAALLVAHFFVHLQIILPSLEATGAAEPWMWGALATPELIVCFLAGWHIRSWPVVVMYAGVGALVRDAFYVVLTIVGEPGHPPPETLTQAALSTGGVALWYLLAFGLASASWRENVRPASETLTPATRR